jgi:predicted permease
MVTSDYFKVFGIRMAQGRAFNDQDLPGGVQVAVVNENFAKKFFAGADPLSQRILVQQLVPGTPKFGDATAWQIVGVYKEVRNGRLEEDFPEIDVPFSQSPWPQALIALRAAVEPDNLTRNIAGIVQSMDPDLPLSEPRTMEQIMDRSLSQQRFTAFLFGGFAAIALLLAAVGIYGVMSFAVAQRTHEIGLRIALGAGQNRVVRLIVREGMTLAAIGLLLGLAGAYFVGRVMHSLLTGVGALDPVAFGGVAALLLLSALLACYVPALRAARVDPMQALREE